MGEIADFSAVWLQTLVHIVVVRQNSRKITLPRLESLYFWSYGGSQKDGANHFLRWAGGRPAARHRWGACVDGAEHYRRACKRGPRRAPRPRGVRSALVAPLSNDSARSLVERNPARRMQGSQGAGRHRPPTGARLSAEGREPGLPLTPPSAHEGAEGAANSSLPSVA